MIYHSKIFGLVTKNDPTTENGGTFLCHEVVLSNELKKDPQPLMDLFCSKMKNAKLGNGIYMRSAYHITRTVSQDELTSFFVTSYLLNTNHKDEIWKYMLRHFGVYSFNKNRKLPFQPACYYAWSRLAGSKIAIVFLPFYIAAFLISISKGKQNTSSKLLYWDELYAMNLKGKMIDRLLWKFYTWKMKKMYGQNFVKGLIDIYFHTENEDFPLKMLANSL